MDFSGQKISEKRMVNINSVSTFLKFLTFFTEGAFLEDARQKGDLDDPIYAGPIIFFPA